MRGRVADDKHAVGIHGEDIDAAIETTNGIQAYQGMGHSCVAQTQP